MQLLGLLKLEAFKRTHVDSRGPLEVWQAEVEKARWREPQDVKNRYRNVSFEAGNRVIFNIKTNTDRLAVKARYKNGIVLIEWVGTAAEYAGTPSLAGGDEQDGEGSLK
jgi:mRNA interferase HigB